jgi:hypothetical protein
LTIVNGNLTINGGTLNVTNSGSFGPGETNSKNARARRLIKPALAVQNVATATNLIQGWIGNPGMSRDRFANSCRCSRAT